MNKLLKIAFSFARKVQKDLDPQEMHKLQILTFQKCQKKHYKKPQLFKHQDLLYEQQVYGNKCQISGITQNNLKSCQFTKQIISMSRPKLVILGGWNDTQAMVQLNQPLSRFLNIENLVTAKLFCKSTLLPIIQKRIQNDRNYMYDTKSKIIWRADHMSRRYVVSDYLNAAYEAMFADYKIIYGKPSSVFIFEDLMLSLSLQQLKQIFQTTLNTLKQNHFNSCQHQAGILLQQIKTYAMYNQPRLYSKQITYTTALLNRLTKIQPRNLLLIPGCFVKRIADQVHNLDFQPQTVYRRWVNDQNSQNYNKLAEIIINKKTEQLLEKLSILSILKGSHLELVLFQGRNFFKNSIFADLLGQYQPQQLIQMYRPIRAKYMQRLFDIQNQRIKVTFIISQGKNNIEHHPVQTEYMYMKDQFETLEKRKEMFLYEFQPKNYITQAQNAEKVKLLKQKVQEIVQLECDEYEKKLFQAYKKGGLTKQSIILYSKLIGKANVQLKDRVKLPYYHFNAFRGFYKQYLRDNILFDQDLKQKKLQMKKFQKLQHNFDKIAKQLDDPEQLRKILTGESGHKVKQLNVYEDEHGDIDIDGELEDLQEIVSQLGTEEMKKDFEEFRQKYPREKDEFFDEEEDLEEDLDEDEDEERAKRG